MQGGDASATTPRRSHRRDAAARRRLGCASKRTARWPGQLGILLRAGLSSGCCVVRCITSSQPPHRQPTAEPAQREELAIVVASTAEHGDGVNLVGAPSRDGDVPDLRSPDGR